MALKQLGLGVGEGIVTDIRAVRRDYFLDHDHSAYVDRWDWKLAITEEQRNLVFLTQVVKNIRKVLKGAEAHVQELSPQIKNIRVRKPWWKILFLYYINRAFIPSATKVKRYRCARRHE